GFRNGEFDGGENSVLVCGPRWRSGRDLGALPGLLRRGADELDAGGGDADRGCGGPAVQRRAASRDYADGVGERSRFLSHGYDSRDVRGGYSHGDGEHGTHFYDRHRDPDGRDSGVLARQLEFGLRLA